MAEGLRCKYPDGFKRDMDTGNVMTNEEVRVMQLEKRELDCAEAESEWFYIVDVAISDFDNATGWLHDLRATGEALEEEEEQARRRERHDRRLRERARARQAERQRDQLGEQIEDWQDMLSETRGRWKASESTCVTSEKRRKTGHWNEPRDLLLLLQVDERVDLTGLKQRADEQLRQEEWALAAARSQVQAREGASGQREPCTDGTWDRQRATGKARQGQEQYAAARAGGAAARVGGGQGVNAKVRQQRHEFTGRERDEHEQQEQRRHEDDKGEESMKAGNGNQDKRARTIAEEEQSVGGILRDPG